MLERAYKDMYRDVSVRQKGIGQAIFSVASKPDFRIVLMETNPVPQGTSSRQVSKHKIQVAAHRAKCQNPFTIQDSN